MPTWRGLSTRFALLALSMGGVCDCGPTFEDLPWEALSGTLAFARTGPLTSSDSDRATLTVARVASRTTHTFALISGAVWMNHVALSPDGATLAWSFLAFGADVQPYAIWVGDSGGESQRRVVGDGVFPVFARDGRSLFYVGGARYPGGLRRVGLDGSDDRELVREVLSGPIDVSPDGTTVAFTRDVRVARTLETGITLVRSDGTDFRRVTTAAAGELEYGPSFSPDGNRIAWTATGGTPPPGGTLWFEIRVAGLDGSGRAVVRRREGPRPSAGYVRWSPTDSGRLAWSESVGDTMQVFVGNVDGTGARQVTTGLQYTGCPAWVP